MKFEALGPLRLAHVRVSINGPPSLRRCWRSCSVRMVGWWPWIIWRTRFGRTAPLDPRATSFDSTNLSCGRGYCRRLGDPR